MSKNIYWSSTSIVKKIQNAKNYNPNYTNLSEFTNHKNSKLKTLRRRRIPAYRQAGLSADRQAPLEEKVKTLMISSHCEERSDEAIPMFPSRHCECRSFVNSWTSSRYFGTTSQILINKKRGEAIPLDEFWILKHEFWINFEWLKLETFQNSKLEFYSKFIIRNSKFIFDLFSFFKNIIIIIWRRSQPLTTNK